LTVVAITGPEPLPYFAAFGLDEVEKSFLPSVAHYKSFTQDMQSENKVISAKAFENATELILNSRKVLPLTQEIRTFYYPKDANILRTQSMFDFNEYKIKDFNNE